MGLSMAICQMQRMLEWYVKFYSSLIVLFIVFTANFSLCLNLHVIVMNFSFLCLSLFLQQLQNQVLFSFKNFPIELSSRKERFSVFHQHLASCRFHYCGFLLLIWISLCGEPLLACYTIIALLTAYACLYMLKSYAILTVTDLDLIGNCQRYRQ